ncbi:SAM-dependent methyltransferase [Lewinella aquimaris]|uniref:SAM-dependent methyltransferase n=1 Tax=Neolewinella aquimaris TaxID=1835722 RepID=A0A840E9Z4_9BACT|nr:class I SAM-dependent methyltransferase [Neolewinella aquimaris]MBB4080763.1 SAM-dependent methyltransferase [Neolewinella aquimaris]
MKLYDELAHWWHLLSSPDDYREEAEVYWQIISKHQKDTKTLLELGSGGGNNAFHLKKKCTLTLTDLSPSMLEVSKAINPECEHLIADMRTMNLDRKFDLVFIHDAIMSITNESDLIRVFQVAKRHLNSRGILFVVPDFFRETYRPRTSHGGHDAEDRSIRYLEWTYDPDPSDSVVWTDYAYLMKERGQETVCISDSTVDGIFPKSVWESRLAEAGFSVSFEAIRLHGLESEDYTGIVGKLLA